MCWTPSGWFRETRSLHPHPGNRHSPWSLPRRLQPRLVGQGSWNRSEPNLTLKRQRKFNSPASNAEMRGDQRLPSPSMRSRGNPGPCEGWRRYPGADQHHTQIRVIAGEQHADIRHQLTNMLILDRPPLQFHQETPSKPIFEQEVYSSPAQHRLPACQAEPIFDELWVFGNGILKVLFSGHLRYTVTEITELNSPKEQKVRPWQTCRSPIGSDNIASATDAALGLGPYSTATSRRTPVPKGLVRYGHSLRQKSRTIDSSNDLSPNYRS